MKTTSERITDQAHDLREAAMRALYIASSIEAYPRDTELGPELRARLVEVVAGLDEIEAEAARPELEATA